MWHWGLCEYYTNKIILEDKLCQGNKHLREYFTIYKDENMEPTEVSENLACNFHTEIDSHLSSASGKCSFTH